MPRKTEKADGGICAQVVNVESGRAVAQFLLWADAIAFMRNRGGSETYGVYEIRLEMINHSTNDYEWLAFATAGQAESFLDMRVKEDSRNGN